MSRRFDELYRITQQVTTHCEEPSRLESRVLQGGQPGIESPDRRKRAEWLVPWMALGSVDFGHQRMT